MNAISTRSPRSSLALIEPQCADILSPKHSPSSSVSSQSLLVARLNGGWRSTMEVSCSKFRRPPTDYYSYPSLFPSLLPQSHNHAPLVPDVGELGLVKVSEGVLEGNIHTATYSKNTTFPKRDDTATVLTNDNSVFVASRPNMADCDMISQALQGMPESFRTPHGTSPSLPQDYDTKLTDARGSSVVRFPNL